MSATRNRRPPRLPTPVSPPPRRDTTGWSAINSVGTGRSSNVAFATTDPAVPGPPTGLGARAISTSEIELSWNTPADDGGSPVTGYRVQGWPEDSPGWVTLVDNSGSTSTVYRHEGLDPAATWRYRVMAINAAGTGTASNTATATTGVAPPGPPREPAATSRGPHWIELTWREPESTGGAPISGYQIEVYEEGTSTWTVLVSNTRTAGTQYHHQDLDPGTTWYYRVSAINSVGAGEASKVTSATTDPVRPDKPTKLTATANGATRIDLQWLAPEYDGGSPVTGYRIEVFEDGGTAWRDLVGNTRSVSTEHAHTDLDPASTRTYRVTAINAAGAGNPSNMATATTDPVVPSEPGGPERHGEWNFADRPGLGGARLRRWRTRYGLQDRGVGQQGCHLGDSDRQHAFYRHRFSPYGPEAGDDSVLPGFGDQTGSERESLPTSMSRPPTATVPDRTEQLVASARDHSQIDLQWEAPDFNGRFASHRLPDRGFGERGCHLGGTDRHNGIGQYRLRAYRARTGDHPALPRLGHQPDRDRSDLERGQRNHRRDCARSAH